MVKRHGSSSTIDENGEIIHVRHYDTEQYQTTSDSDRLATLVDLLAEMADALTRAPLDEAVILDGLSVRAWLAKVAALFPPESGIDNHV